MKITHVCMSDDGHHAKIDGINLEYPANPINDAPLPRCRLCGRQPPPSTEDEPEFAVCYGMDDLQNCTGPNLCTDCLNRLDKYFSQGGERSAICTTADFAD